MKDHGHDDVLPGSLRIQQHRKQKNEKMTIDLDLGTEKWLDIFIATRGNSRKMRRTKIVGASIKQGQDRRRHECSEAQVRSFLVRCSPAHELIICRAKFIPVTCSERNDIPVSEEATVKRKEDSTRRDIFRLDIGYVLSKDDRESPTKNQRQCLVKGEK